MIPLIHKLQKQFSEENSSKRLYLFITLAVVIIGATLFQSFKLNMHISTQESLHLYLAKYAAVAISSLKYDLHGFLGYNNIYQLLLAHGTLDSNILRQASELKDFSSSGIFQIVSIDIGYASFSKLAFFLFGYKVTSYLYLYFLILSVSVALYIFEFKKNATAMIVLLLFLLSFYLVALKSANMPLNVGVIYSYRFTSLLALLPLLHITFFTFFKSMSSKKSLCSLTVVLLQSIIIIWVHYIRLSTQWMIIAILALFFINLIFSKFNFKAFIKLSLPVFIFIGIFIASKIIMYYSADRVYREQGSGAHIFWHSLYVGLALHPEIRDLYNDEKAPDFAKSTGWNQMSLYRPNDQDAYSAAFKWLYGHGSNEFQILNFKESDNVDYRSVFTFLKNKNHISTTNFSRKIDMELDYHWGKHERVLKEVVFDILKNYPRQVLETLFIIKPLKFMHIYTNEFAKIHDFLHLRSLIKLKHTALLLFLAFLAFLLYCSPSVKFSPFVFLPIAFNFLFSLIIPIVVYPEPWTIADQALLLTLMIYIGITGILWLIMLNVPMNRN